jgi:hypothetical protein
MSSTYSSSLRIELIGSGDQAGAWGATTDSNLAYIMDTAIAGYQAVPITSTAQALTYVNGPSSTANLNQSVYAMLKFTGASAATSVYIPPASKQYVVWNNTSYAITVYNSTVIGNTTAAGTGITLAAADKILIWSDGTNVYDVKAQGLTGTLAIANGGTGQTTANAALNALLPAQTNNRLLKSDGTNTSFAQASLTTDVTGTLPVANGGTGVTTSTGSGNNVLSTSPTLVTPALGTPTSGTLTNCTFPTLNQNTTGTAAGLSTTLAIASGGTGVTTAAAIASLVGNLLFPVGALYSSTSATNPGTSLGFGTWIAYGVGRMLISVGTLSGQTFAGGDTGGDYTPALLSHTHTGTTGNQSANHTHSVSGTTSGQSASHTHGYFNMTGANGSFNFGGGLGNNGGANNTTDAASNDHTHTFSATSSTVSADHNHTITTNATSSGNQTTGNLPPYVAVYIWQRTA